MLSEIYADILRRAGFRAIGALRHWVELTIWWHDQAQIEVILLQLGAQAIIKGSKSYYLLSISPEGQTWVRDIRQFHEYLEAHFAEIHLGFSHYRDVGDSLAAAQVRRKELADRPREVASDPRRLGLLQRELAKLQTQRRSTANLSGEFSGDELIGSFLTNEQAVLDREIAALAERIRHEEDKQGCMRHLQEEYKSKAAAACLTFSISSNVHFITAGEEFADAVDSVVKELMDAHRYQVTQKLGGSRLNIQVAEAAEPVFTWIEQWFGGALCPRQLERFAAVPEFHDKMAKHMMVLPKADIDVEGLVREDQKLLGARVVGSLLERLDQTGKSSLARPSQAALPVRLGLVVSSSGGIRGPAVFPLAEFNHAYISGKTGSGKSYAWRALVEEAAGFDGLAILVLDPRNQAVGLLTPEDRPTVLAAYPEHGMKPADATGYRFEYCAPGDRLGQELPQDLGGLASGRFIVSFRGLDDGPRCQLFSRILAAAFDRWAGEESEKPRLLVVIEEAHRFTKRRVSPEAKAAGEQAELALDRVLREGRKYGLCVIVVSQSHSDFSYSAAGIRQNTTTKIFMHNSDMEAGYASDFLAEGRRILGLPKGAGIVYHPSWGEVTVQVRPPKSKVWEFSEADTRRLLNIERQTAKLSELAERALAKIREVHRETGQGPNLAALGQWLGISSKRAIQDIALELERAERVRSRRLAERGQPRVLEPVQSGGQEPVDEIGTKEELPRR